MSIEVVTSATGDLFVIEGKPGAYVVRPVGPVVARYERKHEARRDIRFGVDVGRVVVQEDGEAWPS